MGSTYTTERGEEGPFRADTPMKRLIEFYRANGYELVDERIDDDRISDHPGESVVMARGNSQAGWWSSDMTKLSSRVEAYRNTDEQTLALEYQVDTSGQHLTESDRQFWDREMQAAFDHLRNPSRTPRDLRHEEAKRAERIRRRILSYGIWGAIITFLLIVLVNVLTTSV